MHYYDRDRMRQVLQCAFRGDGEAREMIRAIAVPYAVTPDYTAMILVQAKHSTTDDKGLVNIYNMPPEDGEPQRQVADICRCDKDASVSSSVPIPNCFPVLQIRHENGVFSFVSQNNTISGTPRQVEKAMSDAVFARDGVPEAVIESCFFAIPSTVVDDQPPKTAADNPPIESPIGTFAFDERVQWFATAYQRDGYSFELVINADNRDEALGLLPLIEGALAKLGAVDSIAREFAADELLELKNDTWLDDGEDPVTKAEFTARMSIETISFDSEGGHEIWYADGDLFWGHAICVSMDSSGMPLAADIHG